MAVPATVKAPFWPFTDETPPAPTQVAQTGPLADDSRHSPFEPATMLVMADVPLPVKTPLAASVFVPIPPCITLSAVVRPLRLVMSLFAPDAAAPKLARALAAVVAPVPPLPTAKVPVKLIVPVALRAIFPIAPTATVPVASGMVIVRAPVGVAKTN